MKTKILIGSAITIIIVASLLFIQEQRRRSQVFHSLNEIFGPVSVNTGQSKNLAFSGLYSECDDAWDNLFKYVHILQFADVGYIDEYYNEADFDGDDPNIRRYDLGNSPLRLRRNPPNPKYPDLYRAAKSGLDSTREFIAENCSF